MKELKRIKKNYSDLKIGDIIELKKDEQIPADIIVLKTFNESEDSNTFIRTDQLDGETDWKLRKAPGITQKLNESQILDLNGFINYEPPSKFIYNFEGFISIKNEEGNIIKEALGRKYHVGKHNFSDSKSNRNCYLYRKRNKS